jgi:hypothetical protein
VQKENHANKLINEAENFLNALNYKPQHFDEKLPGMAWVGHIPFAYWLTAYLKPQRLVELGTHGGSSYFAFCDSVKKNKLATQCFAIDTWQGDEHLTYGEYVFNGVKAYNKLKYSGFSKLLRMTFDEACEEFEDQSIDILHIDGTHTYEAVKNDFQRWCPKVVKGGVILFHDTQVKVNNFGVFKLWDEIKSKYPESCFEFTHSFGLGIYLKEPASSKLKQLEANKIMIKKIMDVFERVGMGLYRDLLSGIEISPDVAREALKDFMKHNSALVE